MASSRSEELDDSIPEIVYQCISIIDGNSCKKDESFVKCPLCKHPAKTFYCVECVKSGNFLHSKKKCFERFADKKLSKYKLDDKKAIILQRYEDLLSEKKQKENVRLQIYKTKERIRLLKAGIQSCIGTIHIKERAAKELEKKNSDALSSQSIFNVKLFNMKRIQTQKHLDLADIKRRLDSFRSDLHSLVQHRTRELFTHIFPINQVTSQYLKNCASDEFYYASELEEAQKTTYIQGQWVIAGSTMDEVQNEVQYSVIEPCIPRSGDYSAYMNWCFAGNIQGIAREQLSILDRSQFDKAYGISAALAYTAQLVNILAFYMDAYVPKKCSFSDFCGHESSKSKFLHKVAKLNANIVNLCLLRNVDISRINPHQTVENLLLLLRTEIKQPRRSLTSAKEVQRQMESIEQSLSKYLQLIDGSDSDEMESEFVHVSEEECLPVPEEVSTNPVPAQASFVSSVYSLFKAATGQK